MQWFIIYSLFRYKQFVWIGNVSNVNGFKWVKHLSEFNEKFIKNYDEDSKKGYILEVDINYPKDLHDLHSGLPFLIERMKIEKCNKLVCNLHNKEKLCCSQKSFKTSIKSRIGIWKSVESNLIKKRG